MPRRMQPDELPYREHPLYDLRIASIITATVGFGLNGFAILVANHEGDFFILAFIFSAFLLFISFVFVINDLIKYAAAARASLSLLLQLPHPSANGSEWPSKRLIITDFILALILQCLFWIEFLAILSFSGYRYGYGGSETFEAYANLTNLAASILHSIVFWKELIARKKMAWQRSSNATPCENCGHTKCPPNDPEADEPGLEQSQAPVRNWARVSVAHEQDREQDRDVEAGPSASEPLLVTPEESLTEANTGYGTLAQSVDTISSVPETIVKKKDKGKKRVVDVE